MSSLPPNHSERKPLTPGMFFGCCTVSLMLMFCAVPIYLFEPGGTELGAGPYSVVWLWVFAFPRMLVLHLHGTGPHMVLVLLLNPLIYGLIWTCAWQMYRFHRQPSADGSEAVERDDLA